MNKVNYPNRECTSLAGVRVCLPTLKIVYQLPSTKSALVSFVPFFECLRNQAVFIDRKTRVLIVSFLRMLKLLFIVHFSSIILCHFYAEKVKAFKVPKPTKTQAKWLDYEVGAIVHFNMQTFDRYMRPGEALFIL